MVSQVHRNDRATSRKSITGKPGSGSIVPDDADGVDMDDSGRIDDADANDDSGDDNVESVVVVAVAAVAVANVAGRVWWLVFG